MRNRKIISVLLIVLCLLFIASGCGAKKRESVKLLQSIQPTTLNSLYPLSGSQVAAIRTDYENERTTVMLVDVNKDAVCREVTLDGVWTLKEQAFSDGRIALCRRETNTYKFLNDKLEEIGEWNADNTDGFFSYDGSTYYCLIDNVLYLQSVGGKSSKVNLPFEMRFSELTAFDPQSGRLVLQFLLSPYSNDLGTAVYNISTNTFTMLQKERYRAFFWEEDMCLMSFDNEKMGYSVTYSTGDKFLFADANIFSEAVGDLYAISGSPYLMGIAADHSILYSADKQITSCRLNDCGINGEMYFACYLPEEQLLVGAVRQEGAFRLYVIDPTQLSFAKTANAVSVASPTVVDETLINGYWEAESGASAVKSLQEARQYADKIEEKYGVHILLSSNCKGGAVLCDMKITLTDAMSADKELKGIGKMLAALDYSLALYPQGYMAQFRNGAGEGGIYFLLVGPIKSNHNVAGCTYERYYRQYIALDVNQAEIANSVICHEIWHATENRILSCDYTALPMDEWDALNPKGFKYTEDYTKQDPTQPGLLYTDSPKEIHFVDAYACVKRQEDRARIMEYFMTFDEESRILIQSPFIRKKLQMMCDAVRSTFDTTGWKDVRWENLL